MANMAVCEGLHQQVLMAACVYISKFCAYG